jgi:hypothetical protein
MLLLTLAVRGGRDITLVEGGSDPGVHDRECVHVSDWTSLEVPSFRYDLLRKRKGDFGEM